VSISKEMNMSREMMSGSREMGVSKHGGGHLYMQANETRSDCHLCDEGFATTRLGDMGRGKR
jgi:hypothetical protein